MMASQRNFSTIPRLAQPLNNHVSQYDAVVDGNKMNFNIPLKKNTTINFTNDSTLQHFVDQIQEK